MTPQLDSGRSTLESIGDQFRRSSSATDIVIACVVIVGFIALVGFIYRLQQRLQVKPRLHDPQRLFTQVLANLELALAQRELLRSVASALRLEHPCVLLLGREIYQDSVERWIARREQDRKPVSAEQLAALEKIALHVFGPKRATEVFPTVSRAP